MGNSSEFAAGPGEPAASEEGGGDEPEVTELDGGFAELRRESAAMLRTLADRYDTESEDSRARSARLLAESEAAGALAIQLAEESLRIRAEAGRLAAPPTWMAGSAPDAAAAHSGAAYSADADSDSTASGAAPPPGPGPARGFAPNVGGAAEGTQTQNPGSAPTSASGSTSSTVPGGSGGSGSPASPTGESDDWAPRPFESWRNKASQVTPRRLEL